MINREITYERNVNKSYMKVPAVMESCLDEKLIFQKNYQGILPMEKCYVNGGGQYWYNISGRQALDAYCRMHPINQGFFETLILRICSQLELLEWNLIDTNCLVVDPELIFVDHNGENISFILYPDSKGNFLDELQQLMEYLLTKLNHGEKEDVHQAYSLYNMTMSEGYSIVSLKQEILRRRSELVESKRSEERQEILVEQRAEKEACVASHMESLSVQNTPEDVLEALEQRVQGLWSQIKETFSRSKTNKRENKEEIPMVIYPEDELEEENEYSINPTVCLAVTLGESRGVLIYEGMGDYPDFELGTESCMLGKNKKVRLYVNRETISQFHAKFDYCDKKYYVEDMNSTNGTFVNDEMLSYKEKRALSPGDVLRFADVKYRFL